MTTKSQNTRIAAHLLLRKPLTPLEALSRFGCFRLAARVRDLRREGLPIKTEMKHRGGKRYAQYSITA